MKHIRFVDLPAQFAEIKEEVDEAYKNILESCRFCGGPKLEAFEKDFASFCKSKWCVGVSSGTEALRIALLAHGIGPGDEVITVPNTFFATAAAISAAGATPVFVPLDERTLLMAVDKVEAAINEKTKAIIPVHLFGAMVHTEKLSKIAKKHGVTIIEDCAQAHGATINGVRAGGSGNTCCFSFYPGKNLGGIGEGGAVVGVDEAIMKKVKAFRAHGQTDKNYHEYIGLNGHLDAFNAEILSIKLKRLETWNERRRSIAGLYKEGLAKLGLQTPQEPEGCESVYHLMPVLVGSKRDELRKVLNEAKIDSGCHYPIPVPLQPAYAHLGYKKGDFPVAEKWADGHLTLPMHPHVTAEDVERILAVIGEFLKG